MCIRSTCRPGVARWRTVPTSTKAWEYSSIATAAYRRNSQVAAFRTPVMYPRYTGVVLARQPNLGYIHCTIWYNHDFLNTFYKRSVWRRTLWNLPHSDAVTVQVGGCGTVDECYIDFSISLQKKILCTHVSTTNGGMPRALLASGYQSSLAYPLLPCIMHESRHSVYIWLTKLLPLHHA